MYEVEIDRTNCKGCGACTKTSQLLYLDDDNVIAMQGAFMDDESVEGVVKTLYEIETPASICPNDCFTVYDCDTTEEIEIERRALI